MEYIRVTEVLRLAGLSDYDGIPENIMDNARNRGDVGHKTCELYDLKNLRMDTVDERILPYLNAWKKFLKETGAVIEAIEQPVRSDKYRYQGTPDRMVLIGNRWGPLEIKLTAEFMPATAYQLAAYQNAWNEQKHAKRATARYAVRLIPNDYELPPKDFFRPGDWNVFLAAMVICNAKKREKS